MQIDSVILYSLKGETRILPFKIGAVNIITGESKTGKTAMVDIINYCLGSDDCKISEGVIRESVSWFGIRLQLNSEQVFVARQNPNLLGVTSTNGIYFSNADKVDFPSFMELMTNSTTEALKTFFTKKIGIAEYKNTPSEGQTRDALTVNFKHSRFYCFQPQYLIAQRDYLFYNQTEPFVPQSIKDTLPYFLGAIREDSIKVEQTIASKKKELAKLNKEYKENLRVKEEGSRKLLELIDEAKQVNMLPNDTIIKTNDEALEEVMKVLKWENSFKEEVSGENETLKRLLEEKQKHTKELTLIQEDIGAAEKFNKETIGYTSEASQQQVRLESIKLFGDTDAELHSCPLCATELKSDIPSINAIKKSLENISNNLKTTEAEKPRLDKYLETLNLKKENIKREIEIRNNSINALYIEKDEASKFRDINLRRGKVIGRVSLYIDSYKEIEIDKTYEQRISNLRKEIELLEELLSADEKESRMDSALNKINTQMTKWKESLDLEYQESPIRFDVKKLTLFADTVNKPIPLHQMGSGANWVAYHLLIHFALHKHFIQDNRPVPRFLILDQPSQVYFPPEKDTDNKGIIKENSDETAVRQMFEFIFKITKELSPNFQVIITDHAKLNSTEFDALITEEWRGGLKLVPDTWKRN